jgi:hypothetical protein
LPIANACCTRRLSPSRRFRRLSPSPYTAGRGWGITGSTGYALATEIPVLHAASDLDLLIRAPQPLTARRYRHGRPRLRNCRAGPIPGRNAAAPSLNEWLRDGRAAENVRRRAPDRDAVAQGGSMKILFTFPGQGNQRPGMLGALPDREAILAQARAVLGMKSIPR